MARKKPAYRDSKEYQELLKRVGFNPVKSQRIKRPKSIVTSFKESGAVVSGYADSYFDGTCGSVSGTVQKKDELDLSDCSPKMMAEIKRKQNLILAINMPAPRDLSDDNPDRIIDQKGLMSSWEK